MPTALTVMESISVKRLLTLLHWSYSKLVGFEFSNLSLVNSVSSRPLAYLTSQPIITHAYIYININLILVNPSPGRIYIVFHCYPARRNYQKLVGFSSSLNHTYTHAHVLVVHHHHTLHTRIDTDTQTHLTGQTIGNGKSSGGGGGGVRGMRMVSVFMENLSGRRRGVNEFRWSIIDRRDNEFKVGGW